METYIAGLFHREVMSTNQLPLEGVQTKSIDQIRKDGIDKQMKEWIAAERAATSDRTATRKIRLYLPIEEEHLGPVTRTHVRNEGFNTCVKTDTLKRTMRMNICRICYDSIDDMVSEGMDINVDGEWQTVARMRKL